MGQPWSTGGKTYNFLPDYSSHPMYTTQPTYTFSAPIADALSGLYTPFDMGGWNLRLNASYNDCVFRQTYPYYQTPGYDNGFSPYGNSNFNMNIDYFANYTINQSLWQNNSQCSYNWAFGGGTPTGATPATQTFAPWFQTPVIYQGPGNTPGNGDDSGLTGVERTAKQTYEQYVTYLRKIATLKDIDANKRNELSAALEKALNYSPEENKQSTEWQDKLAILTKVYNEQFPDEGSKAKILEYFTAIDHREEDQEEKVKNEYFDDLSAMGYEYTDGSNQADSLVRTLKSAESIADLKGFTPEATLVLGSLVASDGGCSVLDLVSSYGNNNNKHLMDALIALYNAAPTSDTAATANKENFKNDVLCTMKNKLLAEALEIKTKLDEENTALDNAIKALENKKAEDCANEFNRLYVLLRIATAKLLNEKVLNKYNMIGDPHVFNADMFVKQTIEDLKNEGFNANANDIKANKVEIAAAPAATEGQGSGSVNQGQGSGGTGSVNKGQGSRAAATGGTAFSDDPTKSADENMTALATSNAGVVTQATEDQVKTITDKIKDKDGNIKIKISDDEYTATVKSAYISTETADKHEASGAYNPVYVVMEYNTTVDGKEETKQVIVKCTGVTTNTDDSFNFDKIKVATDNNNTVTLANAEAVKSAVGDIKKANTAKEELQKEAKEKERVRIARDNTFLEAELSTMCDQDVNGKTGCGLFEEVTLSESNNPNGFVKVYKPKDSYDFTKLFKGDDCQEIGVYKYTPEVKFTDFAEKITTTGTPYFAIKNGNLYLATINESGEIDYARSNDKKVYNFNASHKENCPAYKLLDAYKKDWFKQLYAHMGNISNPEDLVNAYAGVKKNGTNVDEYNTYWNQIESLPPVRVLDFCDINDPCTVFQNENKKGKQNYTALTVRRVCELKDLFVRMAPSDIRHEMEKTFNELSKQASQYKYEWEGVEVDNFIDNILFMMTGSKERQGGFGLTFNKYCYDPEFQSILDATY